MSFWNLKCCTVIILLDVPITVDGYYRKKNLFRRFAKLLINCLISLHQNVKLDDSTRKWLSVVAKIWKRTDFFSPPLLLGEHQSRSLESHASMKQRHTRTTTKGLSFIFCCLKCVSSHDFERLIGRKQFVVLPCCSIHPKKEAHSSLLLLVRLSFLLPFHARSNGGGTL